MKIREHNIRLRGDRTVLRPLTEDDWDVLLRWNNDSDVLYPAEGDDVSSRNLEEVQSIYRGISQNAFCFIIEVDGVPVGEGWLQRMNLERILRKYPGQDCRRIDLLIGEKERWGRGLGTEVIGVLTRFGFEVEKADFIFGCDIGDYNPRSLRAFEKNGYRIDDRMAQAIGSKSRFNYDMVISSDQYTGRKE